jgi:hypothetical protein
MASLRRSPVLWTTIVYREQAAPEATVRANRDYPFGSLIGDRHLAGC